MRWERATTGQKQSSVHMLLILILQSALGALQTCENNRTKALLPDRIVFQIGHVSGMPSICGSGINEPGDKDVAQQP